MLRGLRLQNKKVSKEKRLSFFFPSVLRTVLINCPDGQWHRFDATDRQKWFYLTLFFFRLRVRILVLPDFGSQAEFPVPP